MGLIVRIETLLAIVCPRIFIVILVEYRLGLLGIEMYHGFKRLLNHTNTRLQYFAYTLSQSHRTYPSSGCYSLAVVAVHLLKLCCSLCCDPDYLQHAFFALTSALCCPRSLAQAEWIFNHISDKFPANELQWVGMGLKQCRLLAIKRVSGTSSINHQWTLDIVSILILMCGIFVFASLVHVVIAPLCI